MITLVRRYIESKKLLEKQAKHLVALSGGADSVCLLILLKSLGYDVEAVHCNFHLRGEESDRDEAFCRNLCREQGVEFHVVHFDTHAYAELHKVSIEMAARELRYGYFERLRNDIGAADICVAHHQDDNVETVIMNLVRGTGIAGLVGIRPVNGVIKRPLLCVARKDIERYLESLSQSYVVDSTNLVNDVVRNKIRLDVIPLLESINPSVTSNIVRTTEWLTDVEKLTDEAVRKVTDHCVREFPDSVTAIDITELSKSTSPRYVLFSLLHPCGFSTDQVQDVAASLSKQTGTLWQSKSHTLVIDRRCLLLRKNLDERNVRMVMPEDGNYVIDDNAKMCVKMCSRSADFEISRDRNYVTLDADKLKMPLTVRRIEAGDRFVPFGMRGSKLVSDYLTDRKVNYFERRRKLVLADADGRIIWVVGERTDARVSITPDTIKCLCVRYINI